MRLVVWSAALVVCAFAASVLVPVSAGYALVPESLPANGTASARLSWRATNLYGTPVPFYPRDVRLTVRKGADRVRILGAVERASGSAELEVRLRARRQPGTVVLELQTGRQVREIRLTLTASDRDRDADGLPDVVELIDPSDRSAFRAWFTAIAEAQFYAPDLRWSRVHRDCAGLARFAYKEALRRHDRDWLARTPYLHRQAGPDVRRYHYPQVPVLGERVFRIRPGLYLPGADVQADFSPSASARVLWEHNTVFVSRSPEAALPADLLFFRDPQCPEAPMHTMLLLDPPGHAQGARVVYHPGSGGGDPGEVRLVRLADLNAHRDDRWHVRPDNPHFLGFHRWKILTPKGTRPMIEVVRRM